MNENKDFIKRKFTKTKTSLEHKVEVSNMNNFDRMKKKKNLNITHMLLKMLGTYSENKLSHNDIIEMVQPYTGALHDRENSIADWLTDGGRIEIPEINFFFGAKHENRGKIESHLWFFKGFGSYCEPEYGQMIDVGTIPLKKSISEIVNYMEDFPLTGGAGGEIAVFNPTEAEQGEQGKKNCLK